MEQENNNVIKSNDELFHVYCAAIKSLNLDFVHELKTSFGQMVKVANLRTYADFNTIFYESEISQTEWPCVFISRFMIDTKPHTVLITHEAVFKNQEFILDEINQEQKLECFQEDQQILDYLKKNKVVIVIDGINGTGKTTCLEAIQEFLCKKQIQQDTPILDLVGSGPIGKVLKNSFKGERFSTFAEEHLTRAACDDVVYRLLLKELETHNVVVISRWAGSFFVYQEVLGKGKSPDELTNEAFDHIDHLHEGIVPNVYLYCDGEKISSEESHRRIIARGDAPDAHERAEEDPIKRKRMLKAFKTAYDRIGNYVPIVFINPSLPIEEMKAAAIDGFLKIIRGYVIKEKARITNTLKD